MTNVATASYSTHEVAALSGLTYRILDYWCRQGVIWPDVEAHGSGSRGLDLTALAVGHIWRALMDGEDWEINLWVGPTP